MPLKPLQQWICDSCREVIETPDDGWVYWNGEMLQRKVRDFHIVHRYTKSPRYDPSDRRQPGPWNSCFPPNMVYDIQLPLMLGPRGISEMLIFVDEGPYHDGDGKRLLGIAPDPRSWADVFRRLHLPFYEEARLYFQRAHDENRIDHGMSPVLFGMTDFLERLVEEYSEY